VIPEYSLDGKVAIVTGASRSLGRATAVSLAEAGAAVVLCGRDHAALKAVSDEVSATGQRGVPVVCDVSVSEQVDALVQKCVDEFGKVDVLVANAGVFQEFGPPQDLPRSEWDRVLSVNLTGVMLTCLAAGRRMLEQGGGSIVTIASIEGYIAVEGDFAYIASKHGVVGITKSLAVEWARQNIRVNAICPGFTVRDDEPLLDDPDVMELIDRRTPMGRWGNAREIGLAAAFLASPAASYITGAALPVDGGWLAL
jgi:NAD(P)-dependent dehydrogenase (short-subunit alcohol dehydrogenase family)